MKKDQYIKKVEELNARYPAIKASVIEFGAGFSIEFEKVEQAKALNEMFRGFRFTSGPYR